MQQPWDENVLGIVFECREGRVVGGERAGGIEMRLEGLWAMGRNSD